jgi:molybdopterin converting factor subunit 1
VVKVRVRYFAVVREKTGLDEETWEVAAGATVATLREAMAAKYPVLAAFMPRIVVSVNREYAKKDHVLADGDEAALIPPIAGGSGKEIHHGGTESRRKNGKTKEQKRMRERVRARRPGRIRWTR